MRLASLIWLASTVLRFTTPGCAAPAASTFQKLSSRDEGSLQILEDRGIPAWTFYYAVDAATHQSKFDSLTAQGYRMISLSTYGSISSPQYAAVWVQRPGPAFVAIHNANNASYQQWYSKYSALGFMPTLVSATGPISSATYAGVMEKISQSGSQRCSMTQTDLRSSMQQAYSNRQSLASFREYGTPTDRRYCATWHANPAFDKSDWWLSNTAADYQTVFNFETTKPYWRPAYLSISEDQTYMSLFTDTSVGQWYARHALSAAELQAEYLAQKAAGRYIIHLTAGGSGSNTRYAALFASYDVPSSRTWRTTGNIVTGFKDISDSISQTENIMKSFMQTTGVRQAQLSIAKMGVPLFDKAYTWSEPERPTTQIDNPFLLASVSKIFVEASVQALYDNHKLTPDTKVYPLLGYTSTSGDTRRFNITVQNLLDHYGGYDASISGDPTYNMRAIALQQNGGTNPASVKDVVDYMFPKTLDHNPGTVYAYSNYGYLLLSYVVEFVTKQPYFTYVQDTIINPEGLNVKKWLTDPATHAGDNVIQESALTGPSARQPVSPDQVADIFGGDGMYKDSCLGPAALAANAQSLTKLIHKHAVWGNGGRAAGYERTGSTPGSRTWAESRWDGVDWALTVNTRDFPNGESDFDNGVVVAISNWLNTSPTN